ncbi:Uncharacterized protein Adt_24162 [Abeliophyllum distichum]|uniref:Putative plant transposon protein domain-containing protein n=1 Tax=Abeliophyllum distichum TaxID=126358 RepID=A0ABD1SCZ7_9LAMI
MRGQYISFSPLVILRYYGLENTETDNFEAATTNLHEVVTSICQGFDHWPEGSSTLDYKSLLPEVHTLDKMVSANILPTTHTSTVTMERARLLHWLQHKTLNIGNYIFCNVWHIRNKRRCLAFPSLITGLCEMQGIDLSHEMTTVKRTMQIDRIGIRSSEVHMNRKMEQSTLGPRGGKGILTNEPEPAEDESMDEDRPQAATEPTLASISLELCEWRNSHAELEAQIHGIREAQVQEAESRRREHEAISGQLSQILGYFSLYPPPPPQ